MPVGGEKRENGEGSKELGKKNYISVPQWENVPGDILADCVPFRPEIKPNYQLICMPREVPYQVLRQMAQETFLQPTKI